VDLSWDTIGPKSEERWLAGRVAGILWLFVLPMLFIGLALPGSINRHPVGLLLITLPAGLWGLACLVMPWDRVKTPLLFHAPSIAALPYIALLVFWTGGDRSPFDLTLLMLLVFCAYFFPPRVAIPYLLGCIAVQALPILYDSNAVESGLLPDLWISIFVFASVGMVVMAGKQQLTGLRNEAHDLSLSDSLTGLGNRRALTSFLETRTNGRRQDDAVGLLIVDLDNFKDANTLYGLPGGDSVLCCVAEALCTLARSDDIVVRLGGDEFGIAAANVTEDGMRRLAERSVVTVRDAAANLDMPGYRLTASAGWALYPADVDSTDQLLTVADLSLRAAKMHGKDRFQSPVAWAPEVTPSRE
jgi:diguanylate cyclase (GGDEF)-like protein